MSTEQLTQEQAKAFYDGGEWRDWPDEKIAAFQLYQDRLCVEFSRFHKAMETALGRPVWTHEFADHERMIAEYEGRRPTATIQNVFDQLIDLAGGPERVVVVDATPHPRAAPPDGAE